MIIITDKLKSPFDEGGRIATRNLVQYIQGCNNPFVMSINSNDELPFVDAFFSTNKLFLNGDFHSALKKQPSKKILYIPSGSASIYSILRSKSLNVFANKEIYLFAFQPRKYVLSNWLYLRALRPKLIIAPSSKTSQKLNGLKMPSVPLPLGVDDEQYFELEPEQKRLVREKYGIAEEKTVLLHVGHIQKSRNLGWLIEVKKNNPEFEIIIVASSYNEDDKAVYTALLGRGIRLIREYIPNMVDIYNMADFYIFPVFQDYGSISTPLSVLEAMACNLPVITTRFGSLPDTFKQDDDFHFIESSAEIAPIIAGRKKKTCTNREKVLPFTWKQVGRKLVEIIEGRLN